MKPIPNHLSLLKRNNGFEISEHDTAKPHESMNGQASDKELNKQREDWVSTVN
jgi:hypothetical protein